MKSEDINRYLRIQEAWQNRWEHTGSRGRGTGLAWFASQICTQAYLPITESMTWFWCPIPGPMVFDTPPIRLDVILWMRTTKCSGLQMLTPLWSKRLANLARGQVGTLTMAPDVTAPHHVHVHWINAAKSNPGVHLILDTEAVDPLHMDDSGPLQALWDVMALDLESAVVRGNAAPISYWWEWRFR